MPEIMAVFGGPAFTTAAKSIKNADLGNRTSVF